MPENGRNVTHCRHTAASERRIHDATNPSHRHIAVRALDSAPENILLTARHASPAGPVAVSTILTPGAARVLAHHLWALAGDPAGPPPSPDYTFYLGQYGDPT